MTLQSSGSLSIKIVGAGAIDRSIQYEIKGTDVTPASYSLLDCQTDSDPEVGSPTNVSITDFYSYTHTPYGDLYANQTLGNPWSGTVYIKRVTHGGIYPVPTTQTTEAVEFTADRDESTRLYKDSGGTTDFVVADHLIAQVYRRAKATSDTWVLQATYVDYTNQSYACTFSVYDYKWTFTQGA